MGAQLVEIGNELPHRLENVRSSECIYFEIDERDLFRLIMRRLCGAMEDGVEAVFFEECKDSLTITNIEIAMFKLGRGFLQARKVPGRITSSSEKLTPPIVVHADNPMPLPVEIFRSFRANQPAASSNKRGHHAEGITAQLSVLGELHSCELKRWRSSSRLGAVSARPQLVKSGRMLLGWRYYSFFGEQSNFVDPAHRFSFHQFEENGNRKSPSSRTFQIASF
jgi:hypothetical protein